jgi:hypothetical protein
MADQQLPPGPGEHPIEVLRDIHLRAGLPVPGAVDETEVARAGAAAQAADHRRRAEVAARLATTTTIDEAIRLLSDHHADTTRADCRVLWRRLLATAGAVAPYEIVAVRGRHTLLGRRPSRGARWNPGVWSEVKGADRVPVWRAEGVGCLRHPQHGEIPESWESGFDVWLDGDGEAWRGDLVTAMLRIHYSEARCSVQVVLPRGTVFRTEAAKDDGIRCREVEGPAAVLNVHDEHAGYGLAVASALRAIVEEERGVGR